MNYGKHSSKRKIEAVNSTATKTKRLISTSFVRVLVLGIVILLVAGAAAGYGVVKAIIDSAPELDVAKVVPEGYTSFIYDPHGVEIQELHTANANRIYVEIDQIPQYLKDAVVDIEDERFYSHNGIDLRGMLRAVFVNLKEGDISEGASTITQQVIKNTLLTTEQTFTRKIQEQYLAVQLEKELDKDKILELYLNTSPFGRGTNGVQAAAKRYFNKDVSELTLAESACIAGITQLPSYYDPVTNPENNDTKRRLILSYMLANEHITQAEYEEALEEDVYSKIQITNDAFESQSDYSYFVDEVIRRVAEDLRVQKGYSENQAYNLIYRGGLSIFSTQDLDMQKIVDATFMNEESFPSQNEDYAINLKYSLSMQTESGVVHKYADKVLDDKEAADAFIETQKAEWLGENNTFIAENALYIPQPQAAMVIMDYYTGHIKAICGGRGEKIGNQTFNRATQAYRQPGSTFKILAAYLPAIDTAGYTLGTVLDDVPVTFNINGEEYSPKNWYSNSEYNFRGLNTVREGIEQSINILAIRTIFDVGVQTSFDYLLNLGFENLVDREEKNGRVYTDKNVVLALGGLTKGVTPLELTAAYGAIANGGIYTEPVFYTRVLDHDGSILLDNQPSSHIVMKESTAYLLTSAMESVMNTGTGYVAKLDPTMGISYAGKTGTTSDVKDLLFVGYTPYYVATVWMGYDMPYEINTSKSYHKYIWRDVMNAVHKDLPAKRFSVPDDIVTAVICKESGKLAVEGLCDMDPRGSQIITEYYAKGTAPTEYCDVHVKAEIDTLSGMFATPYCPPEVVEERVFIVRPEPLVPEEWDPANPPRIADHAYELPASMAGEYCELHGPGDITDTPADESSLPLNNSNRGGRKKATDNTDTTVE